MNKERKIQPVVRKLSFAEAENEEDLYWSLASYEQRLKSLFELRTMGFGNHLKNTGHIKKVVVKRKLHDEEG